MEMTKAEILRSWEEAKDKTNQVKVLAELNCTTQEIIVRVLKEQGVDSRRLPRKREIVGENKALAGVRPKEPLQLKPRAVHEMERMADLFEAISKAELQAEAAAKEYVEEFDELWAKYYGGKTGWTA